MITMRLCGGVDKNHQLIAYLSVKEDCPMCKLLTGKEASTVSKQKVGIQTDGEICIDCGNMMIRTGACYTCPDCGRAGGCG